MDSTIRLEESWKAALGPEFRNGYMTELKRFLLTKSNRADRFFRGVANIFARSILPPSTGFVS